MSHKSVALLLLLVTIGGVVTACSAVSLDNDARAELSLVIDASIERFDVGGGSETSSDGRGQYALIFDPAAPDGKEIVTVDLADATSPTFGADSSIAIRSLRDLFDSPEFADSVVNRAGNDFTAKGDVFSLEVSTRDGLINGFVLKAGSPPSAVQTVLVSYGISPEARTLFESAQ